MKEQPDAWPKTVGYFSSSQLTVVDREAYTKNLTNIEHIIERVPRAHREI